jgi:integrase
MIVCPAVEDIIEDTVMPKPRAARLETPTARSKWAVRKKPYYTTISPGIQLGYRRNAGSGSWSVRVRGPRPIKTWLKRIGLADDLEPADGRAVLNYWQAIDVARKLARRQPGDAADDTRPVTVAEAIDAYERDLKARGGDLYNARRAHNHGGGLLTKPVALLSTLDMVRWREGLIAKELAPDSVNRIRTTLRAALTLAAKRDPRIVNERVWQRDLEALPNATVARNVILPDDVVTKLIAVAYDRDRAFGLLVEVVAQTGCRPSQIVRLEVADLDTTDEATPKLWMPRSGKGHPSKRAKKMQERVPVPVPEGLAALLKAEAKGRAAHDPLLTRNGNGEAWGFRRNDHYRRDFAAAVAAVGLDPKTVTPYSLRHSGISRALLRGVPLTIVADLADTSEREIRKHYARNIANVADALARRALLQLDVPAGANVVIPIAREG